MERSTGLTDLDCPQDSRDHLLDIAISMSKSEQKYHFQEMIGKMSVKNASLFSLLEIRENVSNNSSSSSNSDDDDDNE